MMPGQVTTRGLVWVCPQCKTVVDYCCSCPGGWGSPVIPDGVEPLMFSDLDSAQAAVDFLRRATGATDE